MANTGIPALESRTALAPEAQGRKLHLRALQLGDTSLRIRPPGSAHQETKEDPSSCQGDQDLKPGPRGLDPPLRIPLEEDPLSTQVPKARQQATGNKTLRGLCFYGPQAPDVQPTSELAWEATEGNG